MKKNTRIFEVVTKNKVVDGESIEIIEVWLPPVNDPEGEMVLCIASSYVPALISALRDRPSTESLKQNRETSRKIESLRYWRDLAECDCHSPLPHGGCLRCDLDKILLTSEQSNGTEATP
jgi:hypothetical protein